MQFRDKFVDLSIPKVMGILNVTPDSFSDGGAFNHLDDALVQVEKMLCEGASFIDIGGESTRPGAKAVPVQEELDRVIPIIEHIVRRFDVVVSIDTSKALVITESVKAGAGLINDVCALNEPGSLAAADAANVPICLMHMKGEPRSMQQNPVYMDVVSEVYDFLNNRISECINGGIKRHNIIVDPGFGFGKSVAHNYQILANLQRFLDLNVPVLAGLSRKSMFGVLLDRSVNERLAGSLAGAMLAAQQGAQIIRVHDVKETVDVIKVLVTTNTYKEYINE